MKLSEVIAIWDILHVKDVGEIGFCDLERAIEEVVGTLHNDCLHGSVQPKLTDNIVEAVDRVSSVEEEVQMVKQFESELESLINRHSMENGSDTPDFILAEYMLGCLKSYNSAVIRRREWYGGRNNI